MGQIFIRSEEGKGNEDPKVTPEMLALAKRYKGAINCLVDDAKMLLEKMRKDYENGKGLRK